MDLLRRNLPAAAALLVGAVVVLAIGATTESTVAVLVTGLVVGILVGGLIAFSKRERP